MAKRPRSARLKQARRLAFGARAAALEEALSLVHRAKLTTSGYGQFQCLQNIEHHLQALIADGEDAFTTERGLG